MLFYYILFIILLLSHKIQAFTLNAVVFEYYDDLTYATYVNDFNEFSEQNDLDITVQLTLFSSTNSTILQNGDKASIQSILTSKSKYFDLVFYVVTHAFEYDIHLMDLNGYIDPELVKLYSSDFFNKLCIFNGRLIGFVNTTY